MKGVCLICEKRKQGVPIKEGQVIKTIRKIKKIFGIAKGNTLVICDTCMPEYKKRRSSFEKTMLIWTIIGIVIGLALIIPSILIGDTILGILRSILVAIILIVVLLVLVGIVRYIPSIAKSTKKIKN